MEQGDTGIPLKVRLRDRRGYADLTTATVTMNIAPTATPSVFVIEGAACTVHPDQSDPSAAGHRGEIQHDWTSEEVALLTRIVGVYRVTFPATVNGEPVTFPRSTIGKDYFLLEVT
jgi:hypothetical protein